MHRFGRVLHDEATIILERLASFPLPQQRLRRRLEADEDRLALAHFGDFVPQLDRLSRRVPPAHRVKANHTMHRARSIRFEMLTQLRGPERRLHVFRQGLGLKPDGRHNLVAPLHHQRLGQLVIGRTRSLRFRIARSIVAALALLQFLRQPVEQPFQADGRHGIVQIRHPALGLLAFDHDLERLRKVTRLGAVKTIEFVRQILILDVVRQALPMVLVVLIRIKSAELRLEIPLRLRSFHHPRRTIFRKIDFALFQKHIIFRRAHRDLRKLVSLRARNQRIAPLVGQRKLAQARVVIRSVNPELMIRPLRGHINDRVVKRAHPRQIRNHIHPLSRVQQSHIRRNIRRPQHRHQQGSFIFAIAILVRQRLSRRVRHNRRFAELDPGIANILTEVSQNGLRFLVARMPALSQIRDQRLDVSTTHVAIHRLGVFLRHPLPGRARRVSHHRVGRKIHG